MAEPRASRLRQNSSAAPPEKSLAVHTRQLSSRRAIEPKSGHTSDPFLAPFLGASFDPAEYLNASLPPLQPQTGAATTKSAKPAAPLADVSSQAQTLASQLNAHTTRLTETLTQLTDDILRSSGRLAYEVELLRGETLSLTEAMTDRLQDDIKKFVPGGVHDAPESKSTTSLDSKAQQRRQSLAVPPTPKTPVPKTPLSAAPKPAARIDDDMKDEPPYVSQLYTLTLVRSRLEEVIKTFGGAMDFVFPPSEISVSSGFLSVSAPEPGSSQQSSEEKGQEVLRRLRQEIAQLLADGEDPIRGIERAALRVEELKELATVWKGTAEEKGRARFVESLAKMVEDRHKELVKELEQAAKKDGRSEAGARPRKSSVTTDLEARSGAGGYGLISQLQRIRGGLG